MALLFVSSMAGVFWQEILYTAFNGDPYYQISVQAFQKAQIYPTVSSAFVTGAS